MRYFGYILLTVVTFTCFSCGNEKKSDSALTERIDSLETLLSNRDADYQQLDEFLTVISSGLDSIAMKESVIFNADKEKGVPNHKKIKTQLADFKQTLQTQRERITALEKQLANSQGNGEKMQRIIASLKAQLTEKENQITALQNELNHKNITIEELGQRMSTLTQQTAMQQQVISSQSQMLQTQDEMLYEGYVIAGKRSELKDKGLLKSGFLRKSKVDISTLSKKHFKTIDIRENTEITLNSANPKIMTQMPEDSYSIEKKGNTSVLHIINPDKFWSVSKFLIIATD